MKILYVLQQSIYNNENKWLTSDSNINMMIGMLKALEGKKDAENIKIDVLISPIKDFQDLESYDNLYKNDNVNFIPFNFPINAFYNRQHFNVYDWQKLNLEHYDIIINNITELSRNIKTLLEKNPKKYKKTKLITQCFWLDAPSINEAKIETNISYDWRQFDGFECSDLVTFTCESTKAAFLENAFYKFNAEYISNILKKSTIWDFGYSQQECNEYNIKKKNTGKKRILFLNRLSGMNYTHHLEFIEALKIINKTRDDFEVVFTNPSRKISFDWLKENVPNFISYKDNKNLNRKEYWELLKSADISVHLFTLERYGGCALRESIASKNITVVADCFEQSAIVDNKKLLVKIENKQIKINSLVEKINNALDLDKKELNVIIDENYRRSSFENTIETVLSDLKKLSNEKILQR